jgi:hypothetical protein
VRFNASHFRDLCVATLRSGTCCGILTPSNKETLMKTPIVVLLAVLSQASTSAAQTAAFDIATFTIPAGWQRSDATGMTTLTAPVGRGAPGRYCQIYLFASRQSAASPIENFRSEWARLIAQPFSTRAQPQVETRQSPDGWTATSGAVTVVQRGLPVNAVLFTVTGHGRLMSVVVNASGPDYAADVQGLFAHLVFTSPDAQPGVVAAAPGSAVSVSPSASGGAGDWVYTLPQGWTAKTYPDGGVVNGSPLMSNGERCQISVFPPRPSTGNLITDARKAFQDIFQVDPLQNNAYPFPTATLYRGTDAQGWDYAVIRRSIHGRVGEYGTLLGTTVLAAQHGQQVAIVTSTGKDPLVSMCFGELVHDDWPAFFHSLKYRSWSGPVPPAQQVMQRLAGVWTTATGTVADRYTFTPSGRYASAAAAMTRTRINNAQVLQTTNAYFGDGAYEISDNTMTLIADGDRGRREVRRFRLEQESGDGGATWSDRLCLLTDGVGEVCYRKER